MNKAPSRWKSLIDSIHDVEYYWRSSNGPIGAIMRTAATAGSIAERLFWENEDTYHWVKQQGYTPCFHKADKFVRDVLYNHFDKANKETVYCLHKNNHTVEVAAYDFGAARVFETIFAYHDGRRCSQKDFYTDRPDEIEEVFRAWWWEVMRNTVYISANRSLYGAFNANTMPLHIGDYVGELDEEELHGQWRSYADAGFQRSMLFIGPPGTGKTTMAKRLARRKGGPMLRLEPYLFEWDWDPAFVILLMKLLRPSVLLLDDIHTLSNDCLAEMLHAIEWINAENDTEALVIATANKMSAIDEALRRPGRFDEAVIFDAPRTAEAREAILAHYAERYECQEAMEPLLRKLAKHTEKITPAYLQELAKTVRALGHRDDIEAILIRKIHTMAALIKRGNYWEDDEDRRMLEKGFANGTEDNPRIGFSASAK